MIKRVVFVVGVSLLISTLAQAQTVVLVPTMAGSVWSGGTEPSFYSGWNHFAVGVWGLSFTHGVIEFGFNTANLPTTGMTPNNFTAKLNSIDIEKSGGVSGSMIIELYDLDDAQEDNFLTLNDFGSNIGTVIATRIHDFFGEPGVFTNVDVTAELRRDLFGDGTGQSTTGFIFLPKDAPNDDSWVGYQSSPPRVVITVNPDTDSGDTDTGTDADTDTDTDTGNDDEDLFDDAGSTGDDCGCRAPGKTASANSILSLLLSVIFPT